MHKEVKDFLSSIKTEYPQYFKNKKVLEFGSLNFNGSPREFFENCEYIGVDHMPGKDVDVVCKAHEYKGDKGDKVDVVITTEMLEHDKYAKESIFNGFSLLRDGGILIGTAANVAREVHYEFTGEDNHYQNISSDMVKEWANELKCGYITQEDENKKDIRFVLFK
mgnify:FL=1